MQRIVGECGVRLRDRTPERLADAMRRASEMKRDPDERRRAVARSREFSWSAVAARVSSALADF